MVQFPVVNEDTSFEEFQGMLPEELSNFPEDVLRQWVYRHGKGDGDVISALNILPGISEWQFHLVEMTNAEIESIRHYEYDESKLFPKGNWWLGSGRHNAPEFCDYMMEHGTYPVPIIVAKNASSHNHPILDFRYPGHDGPMLEPFHLLEGNRRFALLRAMIKNGTAGLKDMHDVWLVTMPESDKETKRMVGKCR
ncbi:hypothetical protein [Photobacterium chitinilyticum]|uniref:Uncharacterized protein n=1 Tax=Photobacterium chitinilyticum TaxID=2485123 RepID=A0A444JIE9_9GAMM|nr:hypothetical protein [Photobacterium chitinilyticum]RWX52857.1 hypothetical protein EDI28_25035 [Photobacterium chitinilyticum]